MTFSNISLFLDLFFFYDVKSFSLSKHSKTFVVVEVVKDLKFKSKNEIWWHTGLSDFAFNFLNEINKWIKNK